jgi:hypothetical protein
MVKAIKIPRTTLKELKKWVSEDSGWDTVAETHCQRWTNYSGSGDRGIADVSASLRGCLMTGALGC